LIIILVLTHSAHLHFGPATWSGRTRMPINARTLLY